MFVWANLHGGYVFGLLLLGLFVIAQFIDRLATTGTPWRHAAAVLGVSLLAVLFNPYTYEMWLYPLSYFYGPNASLQIIDEWQSPNFHQMRSIPFAIALLVALVLGAGARRIDPWQTLLLVAFTALALQSMRHQPLFGIVWALVLGQVAAERFPSLRAERPPGNEHPALNWTILGAGAIALTVVLFVAPQGFQLREPSTGGAYGYPTKSVAYIERLDAPVRIFNDYSWGGYLIHRLYPEQLVFIDGRADVHGTLVPEYLVAQRGLYWEDIFETHDIEFALLRPGTPLETELRQDGWLAVVEEPAEVLLQSPAYDAPGP
jgi:hypothetical protein